MSNFRVNIFTEAGNNIGWGHVSRCLALYEELIDREIEVQMIIYGEFNHHRMLDGFNYTKADWKEKEFLDKFRFEKSYAIVDSYLADFYVMNFISKNSLKTLFLDDYDRTDYPSGIIINPSPFTKKSIYKESYTSCVLQGFEYVILRKASKYIQKELSSTKRKRVLIMLGGNDLLNLTPIILEILHLKYNYFEVDVILNTKTRLESKYKSKYIHFYENLTYTEVQEIAYKSSHCIISSGQSIYEFINMNKYCLVIKTADNQDNNFCFVTENLTKYITLDYTDSKLKSSLENKLGLFLATNQTNIINDFIDEFGARRIINRFLFNDLSQNFTVRKAQHRDSKNIYNLANSKFVRKNSLSHSRFSFINHNNWFNDKLAVGDSNFYIFEDVNKEFVGHAHFELIKNEKHKISIYIHSDFRGLGFGSKLLHMSLIEFSEEHNKIEIIAEILKDNSASRKIFIRNGFKLIGSSKELSKYSLIIEGGL